MSLAQQKSAALAYIAALNAWDFDGVKNILSDKPEMRFHFHPASLDGFGSPSGFNKVKTIELMHRLHDNIIKEFKFQEPHKIIQSQDETVVWVSANGTAHNNTPYTNEYIMMISFEPGTDKFLTFNESMDSLFITTLQKHLNKHIHHGHDDKKA